MKKIFLPIVALVLVSACGPRDVAKDRNGGSGVNPNGQIDKTKTFVIDKEGDRSPTCLDEAPDWKNMPYPADMEDEIIAGDVTASMTAGNRSCYRIGSEVLLQNRTKENPDAPIIGKAKIIRVEVIPAASLGKLHAAGLGVSISEAKGMGEDMIAAAKAKPKGQGGFDPAGMINIAFFEYVGEGEPPPAPVTDIVMVDESGKMAPTCPKDFTPSKTMDIPAEKDADILNGKMIGWLTAGDRNCFAIDSVVSLKAKTPDALERAKLKIAWVEIVPVAKLNQDHAAIMNMTLEELKTFADAAIKAAKFDAKGMVNVTVFEVVPEAQPAP